ELPCGRTGTPYLPPLRPVSECAPQLGFGVSESNGGRGQGCGEDRRRCFDGGPARDRGRSDVRQGRYDDGAIHGAHARRLSVFLFHSGPRDRHERDIARYSVNVQIGENEYEKYKEDGVLSRVDRTCIHTCGAYWGRSTEIARGRADGA